MTIQQPSRHRPGSRLARKRSTAARRSDNTISAALRERVVHISVPRQTLSSALSLTAAGSSTAMVPSRESVALLSVSVLSAADHLVIRSGTRRTVELASLLNDEQTLVGGL